MPEVQRIVSYFRVSTKKQGQSGLGLEAQQEAVEVYARSVGGRVIAAYKEIETGKGCDPDRPQLREAMVHARRAGATLVVAKLDRLSRNVAFLANLMESKVDFVCCDFPSATSLTLHILACVAEFEAKMISERTKAALAAAKRRGVLLGSARPGHWEGREHLRRRAQIKATARSRVVKKARSESYIREIAPLIFALRKAGLTQDAIAARLNADSYWTPCGKRWNQVYVCRLLTQAAKLLNLDKKEHASLKA